MNKKRLLILVILIVVSVVVFLGMSLLPSAKNRGKVGIEVSAIPDDSSITIDGKAAKPGTVYLTKGTHTFKATRQYFDDDIQTLNTKDITDGKVTLVPKATSKEALDWISKHRDVQAKREEAASIEFDNGQQDLTAKYPILKLLPYEALEYKIDYSLDDKNNISFSVTMYTVADPQTEPDVYAKEVEGYKQRVYTFLRQHGIDPSKTPIEFHDY